MCGGTTGEIVGGAADILGSGGAGNEAAGVGQAGGEYALGTAEAGAVRAALPAYKAELARVNDPAYLATQKAAAAANVTKGISDTQAARKAQAGNLGVQSSADVLNMGRGDTVRAGAAEAGAATGAEKAVFGEREGAINTGLNVGSAAGSAMGSAANTTAQVGVAQNKGLLGALGLARGGAPLAPVRPGVPGPGSGVVARPGMDARDDVPASGPGGQRNRLNEGEWIVRAPTVRWHGLKKLMALDKEADLKSPEAGVTMQGAPPPDATGHAAPATTQPQTPLRYAPSHQRAEGGIIRLAHGGRIGFKMQAPQPRPSSGPRAPAFPVAMPMERHAGEFPDTSSAVRRMSESSMAPMRRMADGGSADSNGIGWGWDNPLDPTKPGGTGLGLGQKYVQPLMQAGITAARGKIGTLVHGTLGGNAAKPAAVSGGVAGAEDAWGAAGAPLAGAGEGAAGAGAAMAAARGGPVRAPAQKAKVAKVMHEWGQGKLHSGSKTGPVVKNQPQAVAIALNSARRMASGGSTIIPEDSGMTVSQFVPETGTPPPSGLQPIEDTGGPHSGFEGETHTRSTGIAAPTPSQSGTAQAAEAPVPARAPAREPSEGMAEMEARGARAKAPRSAGPDGTMPGGAIADEQALGKPPAAAATTVGGAAPAMGAAVSGGGAAQPGESWLSAIGRGVRNALMFIPRVAQGMQAIQGYEREDLAQQQRVQEHINGGTAEVFTHALNGDLDGASARLQSDPYLSRYSGGATSISAGQDAQGNPVLQFKGKDGQVTRTITQQQASTFLEQTKPQTFMNQVSASVAKHQYSSVPIRAAAEQAQTQAQYNQVKEGALGMAAFSNSAIPLQGMGKHFGLANGEDPDSVSTQRTKEGRTLITLKRGGQTMLTQDGRQAVYDTTSAMIGGWKGTYWGMMNERTGQFMTLMGNTGTVTPAQMKEMNDVAAGVIGEALGIKGNLGVGGMPPEGAQLAYAKAMAVAGEYLSRNPTVSANAVAPIIATAARQALDAVKQGAKGGVATDFNAAFMAALPAAYRPSGLQGAPATPAGLVASTLAGAKAQRNPEPGRKAAKPMAGRSRAPIATTAPAATQAAAAP